MINRVRHALVGSIALVAMTMCAHANEVGASTKIKVPPAFHQTRWFTALCIVVAICAIWMLYHLRVRQVSRALSARFDERLAERTRIAQDLHDTLLQTIQGSKLVVDDALEDPQNSARMQHAVEQLSGWLQRAIEEGRAALASLRTTSLPAHNLVECLRRTTHQAGTDAMTVSFAVIGKPKELHPLIRYEVYRIADEAIRNARAHSHGRHLAVELHCGQDLLLRVSDDGIGIDAETLVRGKEAHFGLPGMRERAIRIGGKLTLRSSPGAGTQMTIVVAGRIAFAGRRGSRYLQKNAGSDL